MTSKDHEEQIVKILESYKKDYLKELRSDLKKYNKEAFRYYMKKKANPVQKTIDFQFDAIAKEFENHKIRIVKEEIEILENLDTSILEELAYVLDTETFIFEDEPASYVLSWTISYLMSAPIFNMILYIKKLEQRNINWVNYRRDLRNFAKQLNKGLELTENFFPLIEVASEDEILKIFLTRMHNIFLDTTCNGVRAIISCVFPETGKRLPRGQQAFIDEISEAINKYPNL